MKLTSHLHQRLVGFIRTICLIDRSNLDRHSFVRFKFAASSLVSASGTGVNSFSGSATEVSSTLSLKKESTLSLKTILECSRLVHKNSRLKSNTDQAQWKQHEEPALSKLATPSGSNWVPVLTNTLLHDLPRHFFWLSLYL